MQGAGGHARAGQFRSRRPGSGRRAREVAVSEDGGRCRDGLLGRLHAVNQRGHFAGELLALPSKGRSATDAPSSSISARVMKVKTLSRSTTSASAVFSQNW